jgi:hypothetical protein
LSAPPSRWWGFLRGFRRGFGLDLLLLLDYGPGFIDCFWRAYHLISIKTIRQSQPDLRHEG